MFTPQFLITPYEVKVCQGLRPSDGDVYAICYWFQSLKEGRCTAGNKTIADLLAIDERTVRAALERLERKGYIERSYEDADRKIRLEIRCLVQFGVIEAERKEKRTRAKKKPKTKEIALVEPEVETPGDIARDFFVATGATSKHRDRIIDEIAAAVGAPREAILAEARKFYVYWTEPNKSGTKQRWQLERTFDIKRRLYTWLSRSGRFAAGAKRAGAGITV